MKKIFLLLTISGVLSFTNISTVSVSEYIQQHGIPTINNGTLILCGRNLTSLEGLEDIPNLNLVTALYLFDNQLQSLPNNTFNTLAQLQELFLHNNQLKTLPDTIFANLALMQRLNLSNNQLKSLPATIFENLVQLQDLYLHSNQLESLPNVIFNNLTQLQGLYLHNNQLHSLSNDIFDNLTQLKSLYLNNNELESLPKTSFNNLAQLEYLDLDHNQLQGTTKQFREAYLTHKYRVRLKFKSEIQEHSEALEQNYFQIIASLTIDAKQEKVNLIKILKSLGNRRLGDMVASRDIHGNTLLHKAIPLCNPLLVKLIAQLWPQMVFAKNYLGKTSLHIAATIKNKNLALFIVKELLAATSAPEELIQVKDNAGDTPLRIAIENLQLLILQHLLAFEDNKNNGKLGKSRKLNALLQQPDLVKAFEILFRVRERSR